MIDVNTPSSIAGILLLALVVFVVISALITTGVLPILIALAAGAVVVYLSYIVLMRVHRVFMQGGIRRGGGSK